MDKEWAQALLTGILAGCCFALFLGWGLLLLLQELTPPEERTVKESISWSH
jgi:hypothetical protein